MALQDLEALEADLSGHFIKLREEQKAIAQKLASFADGKRLKGDEIVGWLGEVYGKLLLGGKLVADTEEHDFETPDGKRISVKTRRGSAGGWKQSSVIPKIEGDSCPTHLMFVHLSEDFQLNRIWLYPWGDLVMVDRFKPKIVREKQYGYTFMVNPTTDAAYSIYASKSSKVPLACTPQVLPQ